MYRPVWTPVAAVSSIKYEEQRLGEILKTPMILEGSVYYPVPIMFAQNESESFALRLVCTYAHKHA